MKPLFFAFFLTPFITVAQGPNYDAVFNAVKKGDVQSLSSYFDNNVEITLDDEDDVYTKANAINVVKTFLSSNKPSYCNKVHNGKSKDGKSYYAIGDLTAGGKDYRVYIYFKESSSKFLIQEMRFEKK